MEWAWRLSDIEPQERLSIQATPIQGETAAAVWASLQERIYQYLLSAIVDGRFSPGDAIPTEVELQRLFSVSRTPVRQALGRLQTEGLIVRKQGMGSFVKKPSPDNAWTKASGFAAYFREQWDQISIEICEWGMKVPEPHIAAFFGSPVDEPLTRTLRLRRQEGRPVMLLEKWFLAEIPEDHLKDAEASDIFFDFMKEHGVVLARAEETIEAVGLPAEHASFLEVPKGTPAMFIERRSMDKTKRPAAFTKYWVPRGTWRYHSSIIT